MVDEFIFNEPLVSVLMTAYNREKYLAEAIESVLSSEYKNIELIIVDDCSKDNTPAIMRFFASSDSRISIYFNEQNLGDYPNRNNAASFAKGEYLMFVDSDDKIFEDTISYCLRAMLLNKEADMGMICRETHLCNKVLPPGQSIRHHFFSKSFLFIGPGGTILKRSFFESINKYPVKYGPANDMYFNLKVASYGSILCLCKEFLFYRIHDGQEQNNLYSYIYNNYKYLRDALSELSLGLNKKEWEYVNKKNNRRFAVNLFQYLIRTKNITATRKLWQLAGFNLQSFISGIFHF